MKTDDVKRTVREGYAKIAKGAGSCCAPASSRCSAPTADDLSRRMGYSDEELARITGTVVSVKVSAQKPI
jgi:hypothetical protein